MLDKHPAVVNLREANRRLRNLLRLSRRALHNDYEPDNQSAIWHRIDDALALEVLRLANEHGEVGYAFGGREEDFEDVQDCVERGWLVYERDASVGGRRDPEGRPFQRRSLYKLTDAGREALKSAS